jgi:hypothetical protein
MTTFRPKLWTSVSAALLLTAAGGLAGCSGEGEGGEQGAGATAAAGPAAGEGGEGGAEAGSPAATPAGEGGEGGAEGGAVGEAGAQSAYSNIAPESRMALRVAHLKGFLLAAQAAAPGQGAEAASALVGQGMLEVFDPQAARFRELGVNEAALRKAAQTGAPADLVGALGTLEAAAAKAGGDPREVVKGMTDIAGGLYQEVNVDGAIDPIEYQHSLGAALAARDAAQRAKLTAPELDAFVSLWPGPAAPEDAAQLKPAGEVLAQASRVELALSR